MTVEIPPQFIAAMDQRIAAVGEALDKYLTGYQERAEEIGESALLLEEAMALSQVIIAEPMLFVDMFLVAIDRLRKRDNA